MDSVIMDEKPVVTEDVAVDYTGTRKKTDPVEIALVRKLDWCIMPTLCVMYFLNYVDRNAIAQARLNGLEDDLNMTGSEFNTTVSISTQEQQVASRIALLYCAQILATGFSGLIAAGIFAGMDDLRGLAGWRWLFIVEGAITALVAFVGFWVLPNTPLTTNWLKPEERQLAHERMERDKIGDSLSEASAWEGLKQAASDKRTWLFCLMQNFHLSACSFNSFFPTVVKTLGFNTTITLVMTCPPFLFAGAAGIFCDSVIIGWASSTLSQTKEKKAVVLAMTNVGGQIGYIYGAYLWPDSDEPRYGIGFGASAGFALLSIICAWVIRTMLIRENRKIRASTSEHVNLYGY
ncbi:putative mfs transporter protein [Eutypa lata UCREL1]|uniref:Putative mfs transporter protein n=1 Tax=Eutypa lata (strain UCR-EL1) TaxID=1287681 RepID=M7TUH1_EUTLA|nr:putative mfs transporter protein [Eutypa lata UCREL1]